MSKGDYAIVKSEIGGALVTDEIKVTGAGGELEVKWPSETRGGPVIPVVVVSVLGRTGKVKRAITYAASAIRSLEEVRRDDG